jgi:glycosyltransferase involved in cell wall biosynthesis
VALLHRLVDKVSHVSKGATTLFAYSYAAREVLRFGKQRGWLTLLGQIDPGPVMEQRARELSQSQNTSNKFDAVPAKYWDDWREECALADRIVVNSQWSCDALVAEKIPLEKIVIIPLAYTSTREANNFEREYPDCFTRKRPLRVLFLGQVTLLKGIIPLLEAACLLADEPIEFWIVGTCQVNLPEKLVKLPQVKWIGSVPRSNTAFYYRQADVFIFPSFSDGFGLTQLEAQSWKLPLIASRFCGDVATHGVNGLLLDTITGEEIAEVLLGLIKNPSRLSEMAKHSYVDNKFSLSTLTSVIHSL